MYWTEQVLPGQTCSVTVKGKGDLLASLLDLQIEHMSKLGDLAGILSYNKAVALLLWGSSFEVIAFVLYETSEQYVQTLNQNEKNIYIWFSASCVIPSHMEISFRKPELQVFPKLDSENQLPFV